MERAGRLGRLSEVVSTPGTYERLQRVDWADGSTVMVSAGCWDLCGPWDESFFLYSEERKMESMKAMMSGGKMGGGDPMEQMFDMMIEQARLSDEMHTKYGVDEDDFNSAMLHYNLMHDPEIQRTIMMNM